MIFGVNCSDLADLGPAGSHHPQIGKEIKFFLKKKQQQKTRIISKLQPGKQRKEKSIYAKWKRARTKVLQGAKNKTRVKTATGLDAKKTTCLKVLGISAINLGHFSSCWLIPVTQHPTTGRRCHRSTLSGFEILLMPNCDGITTDDYYGHIKV